MSRHDLLSLTADDLVALSNRGTVKRAQRELDAETFTVDEAAGEVRVTWGDGTICTFAADASVHEAKSSSGPAGINRHVVRSVLAYQRHHTDSRSTTGTGSADRARAGHGKSGHAPRREDRIHGGDGSDSDGAGRADRQESRNRTPGPAAAEDANAADVAGHADRKEGGNRTAGADAAEDAHAAEVAGNEAGVSMSAEAAGAAVGSGSWDPGAIGDEALQAQFGKRAVTRARKRYGAGVLVELMRGEKPTARFLDEPITVRFMVAGDLRYVSSDCVPKEMPVFVSMAVWAFRDLAPDAVAGLVSAQEGVLPPPSEVDAADELLKALMLDGWSGVPDSWPSRLKRAQDDLRRAGLTWPADLVDGLERQHEMYVTHDARFDPAEGVRLAGEWVARGRAMRNGTQVVPQLLIRGSKHDRPVEIRSTRVTGVGVGVRPGRDRVVISAYLHDPQSGAVMAVERVFVTPQPMSSGVSSGPTGPIARQDEPKSFAALADFPVAKGASLAGLGRSQVLLKSGRRTPSGGLTLPRGLGQLAVHPQTFEWGQLRAPFAVETFAQLRARFGAMPPSFLRPRRRTENLHVVRVAEVDDVTFDEASQRLRARLVDHRGEVATLTHDYHARAHAGFEALLERLRAGPGALRFVCGHVRSTKASLEIRPVSAVFAEADRHVCVMPWVEPAQEASTHTRAHASAGRPLSTAEAFLAAVQDELSEVMMVGVRRASAEPWRSLVRRGEAIGFVRWTAAIEALATALEQRGTSFDADGRRAVQGARQLALLARARE